MGHWTWGTGTGCCGCLGDCACCNRQPISVTISPTILNPFVGPIASLDGGVRWFNPRSEKVANLIVPDQPDSYENATSYSLFDFGTVHTPAVGFVDSWIESSTQWNAYSLASFAGVGTLSSSGLVVLNHATDPHLSPCWPGLGFNGFPTAPGFTPPKPDCVSPADPSDGTFGGYYNMMCVGVSLSPGPYGGTTHPWKQPRYATDYGDYIPLTTLRNPYALINITAYAWFGTEANYEGGKDYCRLHITVGTDTSIRTDPTWRSAGFPFNTPVPPMRAAAYWRSAPITVSNCCDLGSTLAVNLMNVSNRTSYNLYAWFQPTSPFGYDRIPIWQNPACITPHSSLTATLDFDC